MKNKLITALVIAAMALSLIFPKLSLEGASNGLTLWFQTVLPTLLPFMILSNLFVEFNGAQFLGRHILKPFIKLFHLDECSLSVILMGALCGYPMGAKVTADYIKKGRISLPQGQWLLSFSNHPSPMFLLGFLTLQLGLSAKGPLLVLLSNYLPAILIASLTSKESIPYIQDKTASKAVTAQTDLGEKPLMLRLEGCMMNAIEIIVKVGGYMMIFSIIGTYLMIIPFMPEPVKIMVIGLMEMTTGVKYALSRILAGGLLFSKEILYGLCMGFVSFGGFCSLAQTTSVLSGSGLSWRSYMGYKLLHGALSGVMLIILLLITGA